VPDQHQQQGFWLTRSKAVFWHLADICSNAASAMFWFLSHTAAGLLLAPERIQQQGCFWAPEQKKGCFSPERNELQRLLQWSYVHLIDISSKAASTMLQRCFCHLNAIGDCFSAPG